MRLLHTSDWHLGLTLHRMPMLPEQSHFIDQLIGLASQRRIDAVLVTGDVFDTAAPGVQAVTLYNRAVTAICGALGIPAVVIAGNHDGAARLAVYSELLRNSGLYVSGKLKIPVEPAVFNGVAVYGIPFFNIDEARLYYPDAGIRTYADAMRAVCDGIRRDMDSARVNIVAAHAYVSGAELSESDRGAQVGQMNAVPPDVFDGFAYAALGHLHRAQALSDTVVYSGSPLRYSFGEAAHGKSVTIFDTDARTREAVPIVPLRGMRCLTGGYEALLDAAAPSEDYIRIELTDKYAGLLTLETFRNFYSNLLLLTGLTPKPDNERITLTLDDIQRLTPRELLEKFCDEVVGHPAAEGQLDLFLAALREVSQGGEDV